MAKETCKTILISDAPSERDEFGPHQRVADAISDLILSEPDGGKTIGLEGGWGSGKSTVVNFIKSNLSKSPNNLVMIFDAWAHQGDPLRRTFLESLIIQAEEKRWVDPDVWTKKRAVIAQRLKYEKKSTHSLLKPWARFLLISTLLLPVGAALLNAGLGSKTILEDPAIYWKLFSGIILSLLPVSILIVVIISRGIQKLLHKKVDEVSDPFAFLFQNTQTDTTTETFQTINPTSIEFEQGFNDLISAALEDESRKLVIVLDNLDRIEASDALALLSTLQTFLQHEDKREEWLKRLWILIPYDRCGLEKLWERERNNIPSGIATTFLDKRFQIRFEIPPILLSDWSTYLMKILASAFPDHQPETEFHAAYRVYAIFRQDVDRAPTLRELKLYVNQIGTIHRQWQDKFPLAHYCYYVLLKRAGDNVIKELQSGKYPDPKLITLLGNGILDSLAALAFNEEVSKARQLLLRSPIEAALGNGDDVRLLELSKNPGFSQVLESVRFSEWTDKETNRLANSGRALFKSKVFEAVDVISRAEILRALRLSISSAKSWSPFDIQLAEGIAALIELVEADVTIVRQVLEIISSSPINETENGKHDALHLWLDGILYLFTIIQKFISEEDMAALKINVPSSEVEYFEACAYLYEKDKEGKYWKLIRPTATSDQISVALGGLVQPETFSKRYLCAIDVISSQGIIDSWDPLITGIKSKLNSTTQYTSDFVTAGLAAIWRLRNIDSLADSFLKDLANQGFTLHHLHIVCKDPEAAAYCLLSFFHIIPDFHTTPAQGNSENGRAFINQLLSSPDNHNELTSNFVELICLYGEYNLPFQILALPSAKEWAFRILRAIVSRQDTPSFFTVNQVLEKWELILEGLECNEFDVLMEKLLTESDFLSRLQERQFIPNNARLYASLIRAGGSKNEAFSMWCVQGIKQIEKDELQKHINQEDGITELIIDLAENEINFDMGPIYQDILVTHGENVMDEKIKVEYCTNCWDSLFLPLPKHSRDILRTRLFDIAKDRNGVISPHFFDIYGKELSLAKGVEKTSGIVLGIFTPLVKVRNARGIKWILEFLSSHPTFFSRYSSSTEVADLKDRIQESISNDQPDDVSESLLLLLQIVEKVKLRKKTTDSNTSEEKRVPNS